jgi:hypothetical protein
MERPDQDEMQHTGSCTPNWVPHSSDNSEIESLNKYIFKCHHIGICTQDSPQKWEYLATSFDLLTSWFTYVLPLLTVQNPRILPSHEEITIGVLEFCYVRSQTLSIIFGSFRLAGAARSRTCLSVAARSRTSCRDFGASRPSCRGGENSTTWYSLDAFDQVACILAYGYNPLICRSCCGLQAAWLMLIPPPSKFKTILQVGWVVQSTAYLYTAESSNRCKHRKVPYLNYMQIQKTTKTLPILIHASNFQHFTLHSSKA